ncbi:MAG: hypothetical protein ACK4M1_12250 [Flavobacterium sp.]
MTPSEQKYYNSIKSTFIGRKIVEVFYEELNYETKLEYWEYSNHIHSIDMNMIFKLDNGEFIQIKWDNEFYPYGIGFEKLQELNFRNEVKIINVTSNQNWKPLLEKEIIGIKVFWDISETKRVTTTKICFFKFSKTKKITIKIPQNWEIEFENSKIWVSALEIIDESNVNFWADHLTLFFNKNRAEKFNLFKDISTQQNITKKSKFE